MTGGPLLSGTADDLLITRIIEQRGGLQAITKELGSSENQAASGAAILTPAVLGGMKKQALTGGVEGVGGLLGTLSGGGLLDSLLSSEPAADWADCLAA